MHTIVFNGVEYIRKDLYDTQIAALQRQREADYYNADRSALDMVRQFHERFELVINDEPIDFTFEAEQNYDLSKLFRLREALHLEEWKELQEAWLGEDLTAVADALCDLLYVLNGTAVSLGIPLDECFAEVHRSNMSKLGEDGKPIKRNDGKILKGPNYSPPDLHSILYGVDNGQKDN